MALPPLLTLQDVALTFGGTPLITKAELSVAAGERVALVGRNGSGKSTLLKIAAGLIEADAGRRFVQPGATIRYLPQEPDFSGFETVLGYVEAGLAEGDDPYRARYLLEELGLGGEEPTASLSGGESRRAALARTLAPSPDILLLDEPTNHLDLPAIEWLETELKALRGALVLISHDRRFLETLSKATVWLDRGVTRRMEEGFSGFEAWRDSVLEEEARDRQKLARKIAAEEDWMRYGVTARRKRNMRRVGLLQDMRRRLREERRAVGQVQMTASEGETSSKIVIEAKGVSKAYGGRDVVKDVSIRIARGDRLGIVGPNGAGKTTLLNMLTGALAPDAGSVTLGATLEMVTLDQRRESLDPNWTLAEAMTGGRGDYVMVGGQPKHVASWMKDFLFSPEQVRTPLRVLSGGERGRLMLARALAQPSNLLVLDEPTNDLDLETLDLLEELIADYAGTLILISHDRDFLDRVVTSTLVAEGDGRFVEYAGGYSDMVAQRGHGIGPRTVSPAPRTASVKERAPEDSPEHAPEGGAETAAPREKKRKLSGSEKHQLETLPRLMAALERDIAKLQGALDDPDLYARDPARFEKLTTLMGNAQAKLAQSEERWLELEMLREELDGRGGA
ncbi:ABC-F family ATP-binding cassette domain-containing protein [Salinarimonas chemoclinalis]|uniref:ABC-F family ATP-binding cassette domain-containing protein n=1 Tax=Salinarimonas chemoclinalis TaxID=3241599 RepID=UPI0035562628